MLRFLAFLLFLVVSCTTEEPIDNSGSTVSEQRQAVFVVDVDPATMSPIITLPDGSVTYSWDVYRDAVLETMTDDVGISVNFGEGLNQIINDDLNSSSGYDQSANDTGEGVEPPWGPYYVGSYVLTGGFNTGYTGGCIKRNGSYYAARINTSSGSQIFDMHIVGYYSAGKLCLGFYESVKGWCWTDCTPSYSDIVSAVATAAMYVGISYATAYVIANIVAPFVVAAFAI